MDLASIHSGWLVVLWFGLVGLCIGSFANVVFYRLPIMLKLGEHADGSQLQKLTAKHGKFNLSLPRSTCPCCDARIKFRQNIPVLSWVLLRGRCASCAAPIPKMYPAVELLFGLAFAAYVWTEGLSPVGLLTLPIMLVGYCLFTIYLQTKQVAMPLALLWVGLTVLQWVPAFMAYGAHAQQ
ncbi:prepilin peptidase [Pseudomonas syringae pv. actinidiae]|nr:prepilin peptidase [Pseudomonas syringae pv. actinidiae]